MTVLKINLLQLASRGKAFLTMLIELSHTCKSISGRTIGYRIWRMTVQGVMWLRMGMIETDGYPSNWLDSYPQASEGACALGRILPPHYHAAKDEPAVTPDSSLASPQDMELRRGRDYEYASI